MWARTRNRVAHKESELHDDNAAKWAGDVGWGIQLQTTRMQLCRVGLALVQNLVSTLVSIRLRL